jgi:hypothetical protein
VANSITLYSLAWDNENGCGCDVFATPTERDDAFRTALASYLSEQRTAELPLEELLDMLGRDDFTGGARYARNSHVIELAMQPV